MLLQADATNDGLLDRTPSLFTPLAQSETLGISEHVGPYVLGEELGRGGMGVVYRAYDPRLQRDVALKFLATHRHDTATQERFIDEARTASALDHPHNCPVYDIGSTPDGQFYIAMAYCAGGSLDDRLAKGPLPVDEAVFIGRQIASALHRAHEAGIIHRDIKPANIAFTDDGIARILDFGIAAFGDARQAAQAGTLAYMSPEQLRGDAVDRRTDVWALGAVLYEMLAGRKPFEGSDRAAVARAIAEQNPPDVRSLRPEVLPSLARIVSRALAKDPNERFSTAEELRAALNAHVPAQRRPWRSIAAIAAALVIATGAAVAVWRVRGNAGDIDHNAVIVLPFHVSGDASLDYLREGMAELIAAKLTGEGGLRAVDPLSVLNRIEGAGESALPQPDALRLAKQLRAGHALHGHVVGTADRLTVNASLVDLRGGITYGTAEGTHGELSQLIDRLVARLLSARAGEEPQRLESLTSRSLPALRAYLEGQASYRRGNYADALAHYARALDYDSTFALAGLGLQLADGWTGTGQGERGRAIAWQWRDRLSPRDRALLEVSLGTDYPRRPTVMERLDATERALRLAPDRAQLWYNLGDLHLHWGRIVGADDWEARAERGFVRAIELDTAFAAPRHHLIALYARQGRKRELQKLAHALLAREPRGPAADYINWRVGVELGNRKASVEWFDSLASETLGWIAMSATDDGVALDDARRAFRVRGARPGTREQQLEKVLGLHAEALNAGHPQRAVQLTDSLVAYQPDPNFYLRVRVLSALYGGGHQRAAQGAAEILSRSTNPITRELDRCVAAQWTQTSSTPEQAAADSSIEHRVCSAVLARDVARIDELYRSGPLDFYRGDGHVEHAPLALARLLEQQGDRVAALNALRRRPYFIGWQPFLAASLRDEGRLAAAVGQRDVAIRAYRHYLALRANPEAGLRAQADSVRAELTRLTR
jgi:serine/threonine-protein kinase